MCCIYRHLVEIYCRYELKEFRKMRNGSLAFEILTQNSSLAHRLFLVFQTPSEMSIKGLRVRYLEFITSLSKLQVTVDIN